MNKFAVFFICLSLGLTACASSANAPATVPPFPSASSTPGPSHTLPATQPPTGVRVSPTVFPTHALPAVPTITPTFDVRTIVTVTPAPQAECLEAEPAAYPDVEFLDFSFDKPENRTNAEKNILNFLNDFGVTSLQKALQQTWNADLRDDVIKDLTGDGVPEAIIPVTATYIFGCQGGEYKKIMELPPDGYSHPPVTMMIEDHNRNGIPELAFLLETLSQGGHTYGVFEWNGQKFSNLIPAAPSTHPDSGGIWAEAGGKIHYEDIDHDSVQELVLNSGIPVWETYTSGLPWRNKTTYYKWNGNNFIPAKSEFTPPEFRFQAVQDGDLATNQEEYDTAFDLYQQAIFSDKLKDYSPQIRKNLQEVWMADIAGDKPSPTSPPTDPTEYPRLAAYAYYRMIVLHIHLGETEDATVKYSTLQEKFPAGNPGHPYVEMASVFWDTYQSSKNMTTACGAAIQYAAEHLNILTVLGSDYHGQQNHIYTPADICPFR